MCQLYEGCRYSDADCVMVSKLTFRSSPVIDMVPTFTTSNERICLLMTNGHMGSLRIEDAERLQVQLMALPLVRCLVWQMHLAA